MMVISGAEYRNDADHVYKAFGILEYVSINKYLIISFMHSIYCDNNVHEPYYSYFVHK